MTVDIDARSIRQYKSHTHSSPEGHIIRIGRELCDVFTGEGWASRSRYRIIAGKWEYQVGVRLNAVQRYLLPVLRGRTN